jgi:Flp pilus assembly protein TadD
LALALLAGFGAPGCRQDPPTETETVEEEPPEEIKSPFRNAQPGVAYVGDAACAKCHRDATAAYKRHPMARSLTPVADVLNQQRLDNRAANPFKALGYTMRVERRGGKLFHIETFEEKEGKVLARSESDVHYVLGSGAQGRSYLINRDGRLYQSSISWYSAKQGWGLAPGYEGRMEHFSRPIQAECLFCHANRIEPVKDSVNRYQEPMFLGHAIGCERCHGPGALHIRDKKTDSIINPRRLEASLREAICQQCHLQGEVRVLRRGRDTFDYRPGLPLQAFWSTFVRPPESTDGRKSVSSVEQMYLSKCFRASKGKLGCISCHDPHDYPAQDNKVEYYRERCLRCHTVNDCSLPGDARKADPQDNCVRCHMPRSPSSNIVHTATTDHRIVLRPDKPPKPEPVPRLGIAPLIDFHREFAGLGQEADPRDLGIALARLASTSRGRAKQEMAGAAAPLLRRAVARAPSDVAAREALGYALWLLEDHEKANDAFDAVLARAPDREETLEFAAQNAADAGRNDTAIELWRRLLKLNPDHPSAHHHLAKILAKKQQWRQAAEESAVALRRNPFNLETRQLLVLCHVKNGNVQRARAELDTLMGMNSAKKDELRRWFDELTH